MQSKSRRKLKLAQEEFKLPPLLTDSEIEEILKVIPDLTKWANEIMAYATESAVNHGKQWNGFKVVEGRSVRKYTDEDAVAKAAKEAGYKDIYRQSLITLTEMQRLMGKATFERYWVTLSTNHPESRLLYLTRIRERQCIYQTLKTNLKWRINDYGECKKNKSYHRQEHKTFLFPRMGAYIYQWRS